MSAALIVFAKPPVPGRVKTRLTPPLSPEDAACLYGAFLQDALDQYQGLGVTLRLYLALDGSPPRGVYQPDMGTDTPNGSERTYFARRERVSGSA